MIYVRSGPNTALLTNTAIHYGRLRSSTYDGDTTWMESTTDASTYVAGQVATYTIYLTGENQAGTFDSSGVALTTVASDANYLSAGTMMFSATSGAALWFTEPEVGAYALNMENFSFTPSNIGTGTPSIVITSPAKEIIPYNYSIASWAWASQNNDFVVAMDYAYSSGYRYIEISSYLSSGARESSNSSYALLSGNGLWGISTYGAGGYYFDYIDNSSPLARIQFEDINTSTGGALGARYSFTVPTSLNTVSSMTFHGTSWGELYTLGGTVNGQNSIELLALASTNGAVLNATTISTTNLISSIYEIKLLDNSSTVLAYQDGSTVNILQLGTNGVKTSDYSFSISGTLEGIQNLNNGQFQLDWETTPVGGSNVDIPTTEIFTTIPSYIAYANFNSGFHINDLGHSSTVTEASVTVTGATEVLNYIDGLNYIASYGDLIRALGANELAGEQHFQNNGIGEGRTTTFDGLDYVASHGDLIQAFKAAGSMKAVEDAGATHYINYGYNEGRSLSFNGLDYIASYGDLINALGENNDAGAYHYIEYGASEGRTVSFDGLDYIASYGDLINAFGANEQAGAEHFITNGSKEGRKTTFDGLDYIASYGDLINAFGTNGDAGASHYISYGSKEGRMTTFDGLDYIASYGDLINAFGANGDAGASHYISYGSKEGRATTFDGLAYIANYADLMTVFGASNGAGASHYITYGHNEGRATSFDVAAYEAAHTDLLGQYATNDQFLTAYINTYKTTGHLLT